MLTEPDLSQYALSSTSASKSASFPRAVGSRLNRLARNLSVEREDAALRILYRISSRKTLIDRKASILSFIGRMSDRMTSADWAET